MQNNQYLTTLNTRPFLYAETKQIAALMQQGKLPDDILTLVLAENLFQLESEDRAIRFFKEIQKRLEELDIFLFNQFLVTDHDTSKAILFYALLKKDRLLYEWMREVVWDKFLVLDWYLNRSETELFFGKKSRQNETIRNWTPETKKLLMDAYHRVLHEVGMATSNEEETELQRLNIRPAIRDYLIERKETALVEVILGELI